MTAEAQETQEAQKETLGFQAEVVQLLDLMIHSLYSNKEIFLRELISNASDAVDKLRFEALSDPNLYEGDSDLKIRVSFDKEARMITVADNGIGMSRQEVVDNIGTIAKSGTREFFQALSGDQRKDAALIGQFGVGFYSSFIVADRVTLTTRRAGLPAAEGVRWESAGSGEYTLETVEKATRGTEVTLHLREGEDELLVRFEQRSPLLDLEPVLAADALRDATLLAAKVHVEPVVRRYIVRLVQASRRHTGLELGASPRASLALLRAARARAAIRGRAYLEPDDVKAMAPHTPPHRLILSSQARLRGRDAAGIVQELLAEVPVPVEQ